MAEKKAESSKSYDCLIPEETRTHLHAARTEMRESIKALFPPEYIQHRRQVRKEMLLAWRSMIDAALERIESKQKKTA